MEDALATDERPWTDVEEVQGELLIRWRLHENGLSISFEFYDASPAGGPDDLVADGYLKWDGCINWQTNPDCMYHFCDMKDAQRLTRTFAHVWQLGPVAMDKWCGGA